MKFFFLIFLFHYSLFSNDSQIKEMDDILQSELGISKKVSDQNTTNKEKKTVSDLEQVQISVWDMVSKVLVFLCILVIFLYFVFSFLKTKTKYFQSELISPIDSFKLSNNKTIQIVQVANKFLVLGISDNSINLVSEMNSEEDKKQIYDFLKKQQNNEKTGTFLSSLLFDFKSKVTHIRKNSDVKLFDDMEKSNISPYQSIQKDRLDKLKSNRQEFIPSIQSGTA